MGKRIEQPAGRGGAPVSAPPAPGSFSLDEVKALVRVLEGTDVSSFRWNRDGQQIVIRRGWAAPVTQIVHHGPAAAFPPSAVAVPPPSVAVPAPPPTGAASPAASAKPDAKPGVIVKSPFVGTFYRAPSPDSPPFVEVGTVVKKGQALCIVEAMKLMNELEAEGPGRIAEIFVANATMVELGHPLFRIEPV